MKTLNADWWIGCGLLAWVSVTLAAEQPAAVVRLNSLGFLPDQIKQATLATAATNFSVLRLADGELVFQGPVKGPRTNADTGEPLYVADFSEFQGQGTFQLALPGGEKSAPFAIGREVYEDAFRTVMLGMYLWRCGAAVSATHNGTTFAHAACHTNDAWLDYVGGGAVTRNATGGWHDAGDYNKYVVNAALTVGCMLRAWEDFSPAIRRIKLQVPEAADPLPQFLREVKWELDWLFTMQAADGSVYHKLSTRDFGGFVLPEAETARRYFAPWSSAATAGFVAVMAQAARDFREFDAPFAERCRRAAERSRAFLEAHPESHRADQSAFTTGAYPARDEEYRLWAAAELWATHGDTNDLADFERRAAALPRAVDLTFDWGNPKNLGMLTYLAPGRKDKDSVLAGKIRDHLLATADEIVKVRDAHGYVRPLGTFYHWGGNGSVARQTLVLQAAVRISPKPQYRQTALDALGHLFGRNCYGRSFVTGLGANPPLHPHDRRSGADRIAEPWPGYLVGGPSRGATDWLDEQKDFRTNEIAINWNAALIYALAGFLAGDRP